MSCSPSLQSVSKLLPSQSTPAAKYGFFDYVFVEVSKSNYQEKFQMLNDENVPNVFKQIDYFRSHPYIEEGELNFLHNTLCKYTTMQEKALKVITLSGIIQILEETKEPQLPIIMNFASQHGENTHHYVAIFLELIFKLDLKPTNQEWHDNYLNTNYTINFEINKERNKKLELTADGSQLLKLLI